MLIAADAGSRTFPLFTTLTCRRYAPNIVESLKTGTRPPFPYSDVRLLPYLQHSFWFLPVTRWRTC
jgi:hypothetical protein